MPATSCRPSERTCSFTGPRQNLPQAELARLTQKRMGTIAKIELATSNPRVSTVESIGLALQVDPVFLVRWPERNESIS